MRLIYLTTLGLLLGLAPAHIPYYTQSKVVETDRVEIVYLPNNTCHIHIPVAVEVSAEVYQDYVRACLNNRHLRVKIRPLWT
jgi:hypothetical protein